MRQFLCVIGFLLVGGCREIVLHDVDEAEANSLLLLLDRYAIHGEKERSGALWNIAVGEEHRRETLELFEHYRIGRRSGARVEETSSLLETREEREQMMLNKTASHLEETLGQMPGVLETRVQLAAAPPKATFEGGSSSRPGKAGIFVVAERTADIDEAQIRSLASGATGLDASQLGVVLLREPVPLMQLENGTILSENSPPFAGKKMVSVILLVRASGAVLVMVLLVLLLRTRRKPRPSLKLVPRSPKKVVPRPADEFSTAVASDKHQAEASR